MCKNKLSAFSALIAMLAVLLGMLSVMTPNWTVQTNSGMDPFSSVGNRSCADAVGSTAEEQAAANATSGSGGGNTTSAAATTTKTGGDATPCMLCTGTGRCGWCGAYGKCLPGNVFGPSGASGIQCPNTWSWDRSACSDAVEKQYGVMMYCEKGASNTVCSGMRSGAESPCEKWKAREKELYAKSTKQRQQFRRLQMLDDGDAVDAADDVGDVDAATAARQQRVVANNTPLTYDELRRLADAGLSVRLVTTRGDAAAAGAAGAIAGGMGATTAALRLGAGGQRQRQRQRQLDGHEEEKGITSNAQEAICSALSDADADTCRAMAMLCGARGKLVSIFAVLVGAMASLSLLLCLIVGAEYLGAGAKESTKPTVFVLRLQLLSGLAGGLCILACIFGIVGMSGWISINTKLTIAFQGEGCTGDACPHLGQSFWMAVGSMMLVFLVGMLMCVQPKLLDATREQLLAKRAQQEKQVSGMNVWAVEAAVKDLEAEQVEAFEHSQDLHEADGMIASKEAAEVELEMRGLQQSQAEAVFEDELQVRPLARD
jgi:hypothetical protein